MSNELITPAGQLIVSVEDHVLRYARILKGTGVCIKVNVAVGLHGYRVIERIKAFGLKVFIDGKFKDTPQTLANYGKLLHRFKPDFVTVDGTSGKEGMAALKAELPDTKVLCVPILTSFTEKDCMETHGCCINVAMRRHVDLGIRAGIDGFTSSGKEAEYIRKATGRYHRKLIVAPGIRPQGCVIENDDQNPERAMTPLEAFEAGVDAIVVGRPITQAKDPYDATMRILFDIKNYFANTK